MHDVTSRSRNVAARWASAAAMALAIAAGTPARAAEDSRPYDGQLLRLSELLGAVHYLRELCGATDGQTWRDEMQALLDAEGTSAARRARFVNAFNKGYRSYRRTYQSCTPSAETAVSRFLVEGTEIVATLVERGR